MTVAIHGPVGWALFGVMLPIALAACLGAYLGLEHVLARFLRFSRLARPWRRLRRRLFGAPRWPAHGWDAA